MGAGRFHRRFFRVIAPALLLRVTLPRLFTIRPRGETLEVVTRHRLLAKDASNDELRTLDPC